MKTTVNFEDIKAGDIIKYKDNIGNTRTRVVGKKRTVGYEYESLLVDNSNLGKFHYSVYDDELIEHYTIDRNPEMLL